MARKLSRIARDAITLFSITGASLAAGHARAEDQVQRSAPPRIVQNPFTAGPVRQVALAHRPPQRGNATAYRNPFTANSASPPIDAPLLPGPISRWRKSAIALDEPSQVKTAFLSDDPLPAAGIRWDELPPVENLRDRGTARRPNGLLSGSHGTTDPPNPVHFTTEPLAQPVWLTTDEESGRPFSPIGQAAFEQPLSGGPSGSGKSDTTPFSDVGAATLTPIISDYTDSAESWLVQAQQTAHAAQSIDELSSVADLCQRALNSNPPAELATSVRRLAAWAHNRRGELLIDAGRQREAIRDFQLAISLDPTCSLAIHNRAVTLAQQRDFDAALHGFNRVIELNPGLAVAYRNRAELLAAQGKLSEAVTDYNRAVEAMSDDAELYRARAYAFQRLGQFAPAMDDLNHAIQLAPEETANFTQRGNLLAERGDFARAVADFEQAIAIDPDQAEPYRSLAWFQATCPDDRFRDAEQALAAARQALKLTSPRNYLALDSLAAAHASAGEFDQAIETQHQAISAAPPEFAEALRQRLALYRQRQPFRSGPAIKTKDEE